MSDLPRLSSASPSPLTRALLEAGRGDRPSDLARAEAAMALGLAGAAAATTVAGGAAGTATGTAAASKWLGAMGLAKLVGATAVGGALVVGVAARQPWRAEDAPPPSASPKQAPVRAPPPSVANAAEVTSADDAPSSAVAPPAPPAPPASSARATLRSPSPPAAADATLRLEVERLDQARATLARGDVTAALAELRAYQAAFPGGVLRDEAALLQVEALAQGEDTRAAMFAAEALLARDPEGPHARRLRALVASLRARSGGR
jgi:hypothetical protein